jgi:pimeloyl-ACP methyl ester carboxylesterase
MEYAASHPDRVERVILASTLPTHGPEQEAAMQAALEARSAEPWYGRRSPGMRTLARHSKLRPRRASPTVPS